MNLFANQLRHYTLFQIMYPRTMLPKPNQIKLLPKPHEIKLLCPVCKAPTTCHKINEQNKKDAAIKKAIKESIEFR
jgi:hypothetical protein